MKFKDTLDLKDEQIKSLGAIIEKTKRVKGHLSLETKALNKILGGGFLQGIPYIFFGESRTGKTQLVHQVCTQAFAFFIDKPTEKKEKCTLYFDTENTFRPERIREISQLKNLKSNRVLKSIIVSKVLSNSALLMSMKKAERQIKKHSIKLLVVDTINNHFRSERGEKEGKFLKIKEDFLEILYRILNLTKKYNLITVMTAQVTPNFIKGAPIQDQPVGIQYLNHYFSELIYLRRKDKSKCYAHLVNSSFLPETRLLYTLSSQGIKDYTI